MNARTLLLASMALALPGMALADHIHGPGCDHSPTWQPSPGVQSSSGRYELRTVSRWMPESREQVWIPQTCSHKRRRMRCHGGFYEERIIPGRHEQAQEWVWVPYAPGGGFRVSFSAGM